MSAWLLLLQLSAHAADPGQTVSVDRTRPHLDDSGYFVVPGGRTLSHLELGTGLWLHHADDLLVLRDGDTRVPALSTADGDKGDGVVDRRTTAELQVAFGFAGRASLGLGLPVVLAQQGVDPRTLSSTEPDALPGLALGDLTVEPAVVGLSTADGPVGVVLRVPVDLPTGSQDGLTTEGGVSTRPNVVVELADGDTARRDHRFRAAVQGGVALRQEDRLHTATVGSALTYGVAGGYQPTEAVEVLAELTGERGGDDRAQSPAEVRLGVAAGTGLVRVRVAGGTGLFGGLGAPDWRLLAGVTVSPSFDPAARDADGDGIADDRDRCVDVPEDADGYEDRDGCPDKDNDADGIADDVDECRDDPEDVDGFEDRDGCPDKDNDGDGVLDIADRCPESPETFNGYLEEDGCPDSVPQSTGRVQVQGGSIQISERIYFDTGRATIQQRSHSLLDEVAQVLQANSGLKKVRIEGHTDSTGNDRANLKLSQDRAESVRQYLISAGVAADRLDSRGFGESYPVQSNDTEEGRAANRRVEFIIVDRD